MLQATALIAIDQPTLLGVAAFLSAVGGVTSTIWAIRKDRKVSEEDCVERLKATRAESEKLAQELHELRMERLDES